MDYERGDIVRIKKFNEKYIFLGEIFQKDPILYDRTLEEDVREVMGNDVELGMYIDLPIRVRIDERGEYAADIIFGDIEKFELANDANNVDS